MEDNPALSDSLSVEGRRLVTRLQEKLFELRTGPSRLGRYVLLDVLGRGAMGVVYRAYDPELDRRVALKVLSARSDRAREQLRLEAQALAKLSHPNIVTIHEVAEDRGEQFVAMEYVDGGTLAEWANAHPEPTRSRQRRILEFAYHAIDGLIAAHELGLVHRDIKPANLLVGSDGRLRIADFGLARSSSPTDEGSPKLDEALVTNSIAGTPAYMPPEQFAGSADARSDQFSFCASFFELLYGARPYPGKTAMECLSAIERGRPQVPTKRRVSEHVRRVLVRGLSPDATDRFPTMAALRRALFNGARRRRIAWAAASATVLVVSTGAWMQLTLPKACTDGRATIEAAAGSEQRIPVRDALLAVDLPFAAGVWARTDAELDQLIVHWSEQHLAACRLARDPDPERATLGRTQLQCLAAAADTTRDALSAVERLDGESATYFPNYMEVVLDAADCRTPNPDVYGAQIGQEAVAALRQAQLADRRGDFAGGRAGYATVLRLTEPDSLPRLRAEAHTGLSKIAGTVNDDESNRAHAISALNEAERSGDPDLLATAWMSIADLTPPSAGWPATEFLVGRAWEVASTRGVSDRIRTHLRLQEGRLRERFGQSEASAKLFEEVLAKSDDLNPVTQMFAHHSLSYALTVLGRTHEAVEQAQLSHEQAVAYYGVHHDVSAGFAYQLALAYRWNSEDGEAESTLDRTLATYDAFDDYNYGNHVLAHYLRGDLRIDRGGWDEAREDFESGLRILEAHKESCSPHTANGNAGIARTLREAGGDLESALHHIELAIACMTGEAKHDWAARGQALILHARLLADVAREDDAQARLEEARGAVDQAWPPGDAWRPKALLLLAEAYVQLEQFERARALLAEARADENSVDDETRAELERLEADIPVARSVERSR